MTDYMAGLIIGAILSAFIVFGLLAVTVPSPWALRAQAIKHGYAEYSPTTGEWHWLADNEQTTP